MGYYRCERGQAYSNEKAEAIIIQTKRSGWTLEGKKLDTSVPFEITKGKLLLVVWCAGRLNMNEFPSEKAYSGCSTRYLDKKPRRGPISYAVNTQRLGLVYLGSGRRKQCRQGRKLTVRVIQ